MIRLTNRAGGILDLDPNKIMAVEENDSYYKDIGPLTPAPKPTFLQKIFGAPREWKLVTPSTIRMSDGHTYYEVKESPDEIEALRAQQSAH